MKYKIIKIEAQQKLNELAEMYHTTPEIIKQMNPEMKTDKFLWESENVLYGQQVKVPIEDKIIETKNFLNQIDFQPIARYRCVQQNITKVLTEITFSAEIKTEYLLSYFKHNTYQTPYYYSELKDYLVSTTPKEMETFFELAKPIEFIRNNVCFVPNTPLKLTAQNTNDIATNWQNFRNEELTKIDFFKKLRLQNAEAARDFVNKGDEEFLQTDKLRDSLLQNFFYHILIKAHFGENMEDFTLKQNSQIFQNQKINIDVAKSKVSENGNIKTFKLSGALDKGKLLEESLIKQYNELYKPMIKFSYTEFDYIYRITYSIDSKTGHLIDASAVISERIKNNFEVITQFSITRVEL